MKRLSMFKKLVLVAAFFISIETQTAPTAAKVWKQAKRCVKKTISFYPKAVAGLHLLIGLSELNKALTLKLIDREKAANLQYSNIFCYLIPKGLRCYLIDLNDLRTKITYESMRKDIISEWTSVHTNSKLTDPGKQKELEKGLENFKSNFYRCAKSNYISLSKKNIVSFLKWALASLTLDYLISKTEEIQEEKTESEIRNA